MSRFYIRKDPGPRETLGAGLVAAGAALGVAAVSFYLTRILRSREVIPPLPGEARDGSGKGSGVVEGIDSRGNST